MAEMGVSAVIIGRNEGARLIACLEAARGRFDRIVYVDSGSTDGSQQAARVRGAEVVELDMGTPFTAARARNAGFARLCEGGKTPEFVQFLDGDCILQPGWIETALAFLRANPAAAIACGRRRERYPDRSVYNRLADIEWDTPIGQTKACGGDMLIRTGALLAVGGYDPTLIAGEEPELCVRLRAAGWQIWRLDAEMTLHDAAMTRFGQWWRRAARGGYAYAQAVAMHGRPPERHGVPELVRIVGWGMLLPLMILAGLALTPWAALLVLIWPAQMMRRWRKGDPWYQAVFVTLAKFPEAQGVLTYLWRRLRRAPIALIEYK